MLFPSIIMHLSKLTTNNTKREKFGMRVGEESSWISLNLSNIETSTGVNTICQDSSQERTLDTTNAVPELIITDGIWEGNTWRS